MTSASPLFFARGARRRGFGLGGSARSLEHSPQVVQDEPDGGSGTVVAATSRSPSRAREDAALAQTTPRPARPRCREARTPSRRRAGRRPRGRARPPPSRPSASSRVDRAVGREDATRLDLRGDLESGRRAPTGSTAADGNKYRRTRLPADTAPCARRSEAVVRKFFADRGTHLAAMVAYFALLSFVPLVFLALALLGFAGRADESSYLVTELKKLFPDASVDQIVAHRRGGAGERADARRVGASSCSGRRSRCSACSSPRSTSSTAGRTARSCAARRSRSSTGGRSSCSSSACRRRRSAAALLERYAPGFIGNGAVA